MYVQESSKRRDKRPEVEENTSDAAEAEAERKEEDEQEAIERLRERMDQLHVDIKTVTSKLTQVRTVIFVSLGLATDSSCSCLFGLIGHCDGLTGYWRCAFSPLFRLAHSSQLIKTSGEFILKLLSNRKMTNSFQSDRLQDCVIWF